MKQPDSPDPSASFLAMPDPETVIVPDTHGAVGTNYVMTMLNAGVRIQTRTGTVVYTNSLMGFWTSTTNMTTLATNEHLAVLVHQSHHHQQPAPVLQVALLALAPCQ